jgi:hypothetical protein
MHTKPAQCQPISTIVSQTSYFLPEFKPCESNYYLQMNGTDFKILLSHLGLD